MRRTFIHSVILVLLMGAIFHAYSAAAPSSWLPDGDFETYPGDSSAWGWPESSAWSWDGSVAHGGSHSVRVYRNTGESTASLWSAPIAVQPSADYTLSYWMRSSNATWYPSVSLYTLTSDGLQTGVRLLIYSNIADSDGQWTKIIYRFQTPPDAAKLLLRIFLYTDTSGTFWFDDFAMDGGNPAVYPLLSGFPVQGGWPYFSSPTVTDLYGNGQNVVLLGGSSVVNGWNAHGATLAGFPLHTGDRLIVSQLAVGDLDGQPGQEIVAGTRTLFYGVGGHVFIWHADGTRMSGWPRQVDWNTQASSGDSWVSSVALADIDGDLNLEVLAATNNNASNAPSTPTDVPNLYAWKANGTLVSGNWPNWYTNAGIYGAIAAGDITRDGKANLVTGRDFYYLHVYDTQGNHLPGWPIHTFLHSNEGDYHADVRIVYDTSAPTIADLDGDGTEEIIVTGNLKGPSNATTPFNSGLLVLEPDGSRRAGWETAALGDGLQIYRNMPRQAPVVADLDGDGKLEIIVTMHDGWIRAYREDKTRLWEVNFTYGANLFASEPVVGDVDGDGQLEILFGTYVPSTSDKYGPVGLWGLEANGRLMSGYPLPMPLPGVRAAPTLADLDGNGKLDILAVTPEGQLFVWGTDTPYEPERFPWPTGRHDVRRSATYLRPPNFSRSQMQVYPPVAAHDDVVHYSLQVETPSPITYTVYITDPLPAGITVVPGSLAATSGNVSLNGSTITWHGSFPTAVPLQITFDATVSTTTSDILVNTATIDAGSIGINHISATLYANGTAFYFPLCAKNSQ